jgi:hypothetical protein
VLGLVFCHLDNLLGRTRTRRLIGSQSRR